MNCRKGADVAFRVPIVIVRDGITSPDHFILIIPSWRYRTASREITLATLIPVPSGSAQNFVLNSERDWIPLIYFSFSDRSFRGNR